MKFIPHRKFWLSISFIMVIPSVLAILFIPYRLSPDFTEGTFLSFHAPKTPQESVHDTISGFRTSAGENMISVDLKQSSEDLYLLRIKRLSTEDLEGLLAKFQQSFPEFQLKESRDISPVFAKQFRNRALKAVAAASFVILLYITFAFRKVSRGIRSWKLGVSAIIALLHDVLIIFGIYIYLGVFFNAEIDALFITALLSVMGYSVHDTIVVFDRVRENLLKKHYQESFDDVAERSIHQTLARSINTSLTSFIVLIPLIFFGASEIFYFALSLALGIAVGTYSSLFVATPLLTVFQKSESHIV